jgi:acyl-CoA thioester hydrolase
MDVFELPIRVIPEDIDALGHVNNVVYVRWMQDVAGKHWESAASPTLRAEVVWVVTRHEIDYRAPAFAGEALLVRTWVGAPSGATWERFIEIRRIKDDRLLAAGRSVYAALDARTGRPRRVDAALRAPLERPADGSPRPHPGGPTEPGVV